MHLPLLLIYKVLLLVGLLVMVCFLVLGVFFLDINLQGQRERRKDDSNRV